MTDDTYSWATLNAAQLKYLVSPTVYQLGRQLTASGKVTFEDYKERYALCQVEGPPGEVYQVELKLVGPQDVAMRCSCDRSAAGKICQHIVAGLLAAINHRPEESEGNGATAVKRPEQNDPSQKTSRLDWRSLWNQVRSLAGRRGFGDQYLVLSLQRKSVYYNVSYYQIVPYVVSAIPLVELGYGPQELQDPKVLVEALGKLPAYHFKEQRGPQISQLHQQRFINAGLELATLVPWLMLSSSSYYDFYYDDSKRALKLGGVLQWLATENKSVPLFLGTERHPARTPVTVLSGLLYPCFRLRNLEDGSLEVTVELPDLYDSQRAPLRYQQYEIVLQNPFWVLLDNQFLARTTDASMIAVLQELWGEMPVTVPAEERGEFLNAIAPLLDNELYVPDVTVLPRFVDTESFVPRLYLREENGELQAELRFAYDDYELPYDKNGSPYSLVWVSPKSLEVAWLRRWPQQEEERARALAQFGLKRGKPPGTFLLRKRVDTVDFLLKHLPRLAAAGYEIYGEESIRSVRVNRNRPTIAFQVSSGIDWFDVAAVVKFGEVEASIKELRRALRKKERYIKLADGSIGEIPEEWIERLRRLFGVAQVTEDEELRFDAIQVTLLDQLLAEADGLQADERFRERLERLRGFQAIQEKPLPQGFVGELRPYQVAGYHWLHFLHDYEMGGCLADDMGLGKTVQVLAFLQSLREQGHAQAPDLIVVPKSLLVNWEREAARFTPNLRVRIHAGKDRAKDPGAFAEDDLVITTYGLVLRDLAMLRRMRFHYVVLDESQAVKNPLAKRSRAVRALESDHRLALTGTPVENNTLELWSLFAFLNPGLLGSLEYFRSEFANPIERRKDEETANMLQRMVHPFILRRTKEQVAPELPPRTERILYTDMEPAQRRLYERWRDYYRGMVLGLLEEEKGGSVHMKILEGLLRLRQIAIHPKLMDKDFRGQSAKFELLFETLATLREEGHKVLIFSQFVQALKLLREHLDQAKVPYVYLDGRTRKRQERVDQFQNDPNIPFFLISLKAGGVGLNLTAADYVIHIDPWWNPAVERQASDRTHRIGQDKPVFVYKLITRGTVEEKILALQERKRNLVDQLISTETAFFKQLTPDDIQLLFSQ